MGDRLLLWITRNRDFFVIVALAFVLPEMLACVDYVCGGVAGRLGGQMECNSEWRRFGAPTAREERRPVTEACDRSLRLEPATGASCDSGRRDVTRRIVAKTNNYSVISSGREWRWSANMITLRQTWFPLTIFADGPVRIHHQLCLLWRCWICVVTHLCGFGCFSDPNIRQN